MRIEEVTEVMQKENRPMTATEIASIVAPGTNFEQNLEARKRVSAILRTLCKHRITEVVAMKSSYPHTNIWDFTRD